MPNWAVGNIRFRGKIENIIELLRNEILVEGRYVDENGESVEYESQPLVIDSRNEIGRITIMPSNGPADANGCTYSFYVNGSRSNFIRRNSSSHEVSSEWVIKRQGEECVVLFEEFKAACSVDGKLYSDLAQKYSADIRILTWECGDCFVQEIEALRDGTLKEKCHEYKDWDW